VPLAEGPGTATHDGAELVAEGEDVGVAQFIGDLSDPRVVLEQAVRGGFDALVCQPGPSGDSVGRLENPGEAGGRDPED
jgi:hypothetical protein